MYFVYVLKSKDYPKSYVGHTDNLDRRLIQHNTGLGIYTRRYLPWMVVHVEEYTFLEEAIAREKYLKTRNGRRFLKNVVFK